MFAFRRISNFNKKKMNFSVELKNGKLLKGFIKNPGENPAGIIAFVHGIGEHLGRYKRWSELFSSENYAFIGFDLPGHGQSEGKRGHVRSYDAFYEMINLMLETINRAYPMLPVWLYGHSLGGGIVIDYTLKFNPGVKGVIATGPWLKLAFDLPGYKKILASIAGLVLPGLIQPTGLNTIYLSHDKSVVELYNSDPLVHAKISASLFSGAMKSASFSLKNAHLLKKQLLIMHGSDDMICSPEGSRQFAEKTPMAELKIWEGGYHELHNEKFSDEVFSYIVEWIKKKSR